MTRSPPTGTPTFLYTDIEGSTRLRQAEPEAFNHSLRLHHAVLRQAIEGHGGFVFKLVGDAFCAAFDSAATALRAALSAQRELHQSDWGAAPMRVRMALHTGAAAWSDGEYEGLTMVRVARLLPAGHGGQVLLSRPTADLLQYELPPGCSLRDLGERRLKDLIHPEHIFQLVAAGLPAEFAPLKTLTMERTSLPAPATSFVGRAAELAAISRLYMQARLVTLVGPGGSGKTRLAVKAVETLVEAFSDGVWFIDLAPVSDASLVLHVVANVLGVRESPGRPIQAGLDGHLKGRNTLLLLDNCEHLVEACAELATSLLAADSRLKLLATSREPLGVAGEFVLPVPPLSCPDPNQMPTLESLPQYDAVRLFVERASASHPAFSLTAENASLVAQICHHLDGIPLAIELAAARVRHLPLEQIAARFHDRFRLLSSGRRTAVPRQQTLRALIDWSYDLLPHLERTLFQRLAVFPGQWSLNAAEQVCSDNGLPAEEVLEVLGQLTDKSMVVLDHQTSGGRYRMLETLQHYGREKLVEAGEWALMRKRHAGYISKIAKRSAVELLGPEQGLWVERLAEIRDDLHWALKWYAESPDRNPKGLRLSAALGRYWYNQGPWDEGYGYYKHFLPSQPPIGPGSGVWANAMLGMGWLATKLGRFAEAQACFEPSARVFRTLNLGSPLAHALVGLLASKTVAGDSTDLDALGDEVMALGEELGDHNVVALALTANGLRALMAHDYERAKTLVNQSMALEHITTRAEVVSPNICFLGLIAIHQGRHADARDHLAAYLGMLNRGLGDVFYLPHSLAGLAAVLAAEGKPEHAAELCGAVSIVCELLNETIIWGMYLPGLFEAVRTQLDSGTFERAWASGRGMSIDQAIKAGLRT